MVHHIGPPETGEIIDDFSDLKNPAIFEELFQKFGQQFNQEFGNDVKNFVTLLQSALFKFFECYSNFSVLETLSADRETFLIIFDNFCEFLSEYKENNIDLTPFIKDVPEDQMIPVLIKYLHPDNQRKIAFLPGEISDYQKSKTSFGAFKETIQKIQTGTTWDQIDVSEIRAFQSGLTLFEANFKDFTQSEFKVINDFLHIHKSGFDIRVSDGIRKTIFCLEHIGFDAWHRDVAMEFIFETEISYRGQDRRDEISDWDPTLPEAHFNHILSMTGMGMGALDTVKKNPAILSTPDELLVFAKDNIEKLIYVLTHLSHDFIEDGLGDEEVLKNLLEKILEKHAPKNLENREKIIKEIITRVGENAQRLNAENPIFMGTDGIKNHDLYYDAPLSDEARSTKFSDAMDNNTGSPYTNNPRKLLAQDRFLNDAYQRGWFRLIRTSTLKQAWEHNPHLLDIKNGFWSKVKSVLEGSPTASSVPVQKS